MAAAWGPRYATGDVKTGNIVKGGLIRLVYAVTSRH